MKHVVVVGSSLAGMRACGGLRANGFEGDITLIGEEPHHPYDRPPLSKKLLAGDWEPARIELLRTDELETLQLDQRLGVAATGVDLGERLVHIADGSSVAFDALVIATGSRLRRLPFQPDHPSVRELRTLDDSLALRDRLAGGGQRLTVIGAGFIGLEVAATARQLGNDVVVLEGAPAPLIRGLGAEMGNVVAALHAEHGVPVRVNVQITGMDAGAHGVTVHVAHDGDGDDVVVSDVVVVGVGVAPSTDWLDGSGLELRDGVVCDATLNAGAAGVYAAGDVARWPNPQFGGEEMRVEHWTNAAEQGSTVANNLLASWAGDEPQPYSAVPFFWSDQYRTRIQFLGRAAGDDEVRIVKGSVDDRSFLALYGKDGRLRGALGLAMPKPLMQCRRFFLEGLTFDEATEAAVAL